MTNEPSYTTHERVILWTIALAGFAALNGTFLYGTFAEPAMLEAALANPLSIVFLVEALVLTGLLAYLLQKWRVTRMSWVWFVVVALAGSLAFALPVAILWRRRDR